MAKPSGDHTPLGGFVSIGALASVIEMNPRNDKRDSPLAPVDLAKQFRDWQRLRKQVNDLEKQAVQNAGEVCSNTNEKRRE